MWLLQGGVHKMQSEKILIIDDDSGVRKSLSAFLIKNGYNIKTAPGGDPGLKIIKEEKIDLILLDIRMPEMDGITTLKRIKEIKPTLNIIIITGFGSIETAVEAMKNGAIDYVKKPFNLDQLLDKINTALKVNYLVIKD